MRVTLDLALRDLHTYRLLRIPLRRLAGKQPPPSTPYLRSEVQVDSQGLVADSRGPVPSQACASASGGQALSQASASASGRQAASDGEVSPQRDQVKSTAAGRPVAASRRCKCTYQCRIGRAHEFRKPWLGSITIVNRKHSPASPIARHASASWMIATSPGSASSRCPLVIFICVSTLL